MRIARAQEHTVALTLPRWIAAAVAGCLILVASFLTPRAPKPRPENPRTPFVRDLYRAASAASEAAARLQALALRDSILAITARPPRSDSSRTLVSSALPPSVRSAVGVLGARASLMRARPATSPIDIAFVLDTASLVRGRSVSRATFRVTHVLPPVGRAHCLAIGRIHRLPASDERAVLRNRRTYLTGTDVAARLLGPCAFYEAFGAPGAAIDGWLASGAWRFGLSGALRGGSESMRVRKPVGSEGWQLRQYVTPVGYRCAAGDARSCREATLDLGTDRAVRVIQRVGADRIVTRTRADEYSWTTTLGPAEPMLLRDMARSVGADKFRRFWASDKPPTEAFFAATGQDIGAWTAAWARNNYGDVRRGPGTDASSVTWAALLSVLGLSGAIVSSRRRQVA